MYGDFQKRLSQCRAINQKQTRLIFRKLNLAQDELIMLQEFLRMAENCNGDISCAPLPAFIRLLERVLWAMSESCVLICPDLDPMEAEIQERNANNPYFDEHAA